MRGRRHKGTLTAGKTTFPKLRLAERPPHPEFGQNSAQIPDLSPQAGRGKDGAAAALILAPKGTRPAKGVAVRCSRHGKEFTSGRARPALEAGLGVDAVCSKV